MYTPGTDDNMTQKLTYIRRSQQARPFFAFASKNFVLVLFSLYGSKNSIKTSFFSRFPFLLFYPGYLVYFAGRARLIVQAFSSLILL